MKQNVKEHCSKRFNVIFRPDHLLHGGKRIRPKQGRVYIKYGGRTDHAQCHFYTYFSASLSVVIGIPVFSLLLCN